MEKAFNYRFYPSPEQESLLRRTLGCVRLVYNKALHERTQGWYERQEKIGYNQTSSMLTFDRQYFLRLRHHLLPTSQPYLVVFDEFFVYHSSDPLSQLLKG
ncbi:helix-turn-helix domain-containing protein [Planktothrix prolifica]|uniref:helix-turn-helix domain-containing protein n=1 Tax=Planktothrix prolifica TaxID=54307 RepID=UPI003C6E8142